MNNHNDWNISERRKKLENGKNLEQIQCVVRKLMGSFKRIMDKSDEIEMVQCGNEFEMCRWIERKVVEEKNQIERTIGSILNGTNLHR